MTRLWLVLSKCAICHTGFATEESTFKPTSALDAHIEKMAVQKCAMSFGGYHTITGLALELKHETIQGEAVVKLRALTSEVMP